MLFHLTNTRCPSQGPTVASLTRTRVGTTTGDPPLTEAQDLEGQEGLRPQAWPPIPAPLGEAEAPATALSPEHGCAMLSLSWNCSLFCRAGSPQPSRRELCLGEGRR